MIDLEKHIQYVEEFYTGMEEEGLDREENWLRFKAVTDAARAYLSIASVTDEDRKRALDALNRLAMACDPSNETMKLIRTIRACLLNGNTGWMPIETAPNDETIILANFKERCLLTGAPHVWTATFVTKWIDGEGNVSDDMDMQMWTECSHAATNENGEPTHWMSLPASPVKEGKRYVCSCGDESCGA